MKIAVIPWSEVFLNDKLFDISDIKINHDKRLEPYAAMKGEFEKRHDEFHTVDLYDDLGKVDFFLFFAPDLVWLEKLIKLGLQSRMIYCNAEPPTVISLNCEKGFRKILHFFPALMTWNDGWVDNKRIFKRNIPYYFAMDLGDVPFERRKLLTCISGNKHSPHPDELYSERERVIYSLERTEPELFDLYGVGWDKGVHPSYVGKARDKAEVYHQYRFALAFENMKNVKGYVTEKILDCLTSGIVPVYFGATNIEEYVPEKCFIRYEKFENPNEMIQYLKKMPAEEYADYLKAAQDFLASDMIRKFDGEEYARDIYYLIEHAKMESFQVAFIYKWMLKMVLGVQMTKKAIKIMLKKVLKNKVLGYWLRRNA